MCGSRPGETALQALQGARGDGRGWLRPVGFVNRIPHTRSYSYIGGLGRVDGRAVDRRPCSAAPSNARCRCLGYHRQRNCNWG